MSLYVNIKKKLGSFLLNVSLTSESGVTGLLGASGSGKTLTLRCISGILTPDKGTIVLNGVTLFDSEKGINLPPQKRKIGYLFQNYALFPNMTVERNIACGLHHEKDKAARKTAVADMIEKMHLKGLEKHKPHELSGGQQQRAALARILVGKPDILLLDEPFSALDSHLRDHLLIELWHTLKTFDGDALLVTHSRNEAYKLCNRLAVMDSGHLTCVGDTKEIFSHPKTRAAAVLTGCKNIVAAQKAGETCVFVPEWGVTFETEKTIGDGLCAIGVRSHCFDVKAKQNSYPIRLVDRSEEPFASTLRFVYENQKMNSEPVWWRVIKTDNQADLPRSIGLDPKNVLLLYE